MKKITLISVEKVVAVIDYSAFETWRAGEPIQTSDKILDKVKKVVGLPKYHNCLVDCQKKTITLVVYVDSIIVDDQN
jgi:hypothetical protein